jgi:hypothetical protein
MVLGKTIKYTQAVSPHGTGLASGLDVQNVIQGQQYYKKVVQKAGKPVKGGSAQTVMNAKKISDAMGANAELQKIWLKKT